MAAEPPVQPPVQPPVRRRSWLKRTLLVVGIILALVILLPLAWAVGDAFFGSNAGAVANVEYADAAGNELVGYLARPDGEGPHPAVLLLHEWWGLNHEITALADALARRATWSSPPTRTGAGWATRCRAPCGCA